MIQASEGVLPDEEQQALGHIIDQIGSEKPDLAEAIQPCRLVHSIAYEAALHRFEAAEREAPQ